MAYGIWNYDFSYQDYDVYPFFFENDWKKGVEVRATFQTVISQSKRHVEQRRPLHANALREIKAHFTIRNLTHQKLLNDLKIIQGHPLLVPHYDEPIRANQAIQGGADIYTDEDFTNYWWLNNRTSRIMIFSEEDKLYAVYQLSQVTGTKIELTASVSEAFDITKTIIYPGFFGVVGKPRFSYVTDRLAQCSLTFKEVLLNSYYPV